MLLFLFLICMNKSIAFDTTIVTQLLHRIDQLQVKENGVFPKGLFPSYRTYALNQDRQKADINPFFTGLILFTLQKHKDKLTTYQKYLVNNITTASLPALLSFKNTERNTFNFWSTNEKKIFPNSGWLNLLDKTNALPDDMDDTVIILMAMNSDKMTSSEVHNLMQYHANNGNYNINRVITPLRKFGAYSTWFGVKWPIDFDICVLSNVLYFVQSNEFIFNKADSASLKLIEMAIKDDLHIKLPKMIAPHYTESSIILYHIARLMNLKKNEDLEKFKPKLIEQAKFLLKNSNVFMEKVILQTSLMYWGIQPSITIIENSTELQSLIELENFSFFKANMASFFSANLKKIGTSLNLGLFNYYCPAYNNILLLEHIVVNNSFKE